MLVNQSDKFDLPDDVNYLNGAFMSPLLKEEASIGEHAVRKKLRPYQISVADFFTDVQKVREEFSQLINGNDPARIVMIPSVSYGIANVTNNIQLNGRKIILVSNQFPSNVYPWLELAKRQGGRVELIEPPDDWESRGEQWNESLLNTIDDHTAVVAIAHVHWADGTRFNLEAIREKTRRHDALLIIDGTQSIGVLPFDLSKFEPDALICAGYKWLLGPYGLGVAYYGDAFDAGKPVEENWINRKGSDDFAALVDYDEDYQQGSLRYGMGEQSNFILVPMLLRALQQLNEWQPENIQAYCQSITEGPIEQLRNFGFWIEEEAFRSAHLFGIRHSRLDAEQLKQKLDQENIHVSLRGNAIRVAPYVHNTEDDLYQLADVLKTFI